MSAPGLSIVIPSRDGAARIPETLASIARQEVSCNVEVVVVDDGSSDGTRNAAAGVALPWGPPSVLRHDVGRGRAAACNTGLGAARAPVVVVLDDDMTLEPGAIAAHRAFHERRARQAALGRIVLAPGSEPASCFRRFLEREQAFREGALLDRRDDVPFPMCLTGHFSAARDVLEEAGGFDASIARYGFEDIDLGYRLHGAGIRIAYLPEAVSIHRAYMTDLDRYLARQREAGLVARELAARYPDGPFREYLRVDGPARLGLGRSPAGLVGLRLANRILLIRPFRRLLGSRAGFAALLGLLAAGERAGLDRAVHFGYHVARDVRYFQGCFDDPAEGGAA
jgi:glycosyltransferase involved in cell wall biosynthesis